MWSVYFSNNPKIHRVVGLLEICIQEVNYSSIKLCPGIAGAERMIHAGEDHHIEEMTFIAEFGCVFKCIVKVYVVVA